METLPGSHDGMDIFATMSGQFLDISPWASTPIRHDGPDLGKPWPANDIRAQRYANWSRRRVNAEISAALPASSMALS